MKSSSTLFVKAGSAVLMTAVILSGCTFKGKSASKSDAADHSFSIVTTIFAPYDFARQVAKDTGTSIKMLLPPGSEVHSWEPTAQDIISIQKSGLFIYAGGKGDVWADKIVSASDSKLTALRMTDCVHLFEEEHPEGMEPEKEEGKENEKANEETEWDEHVWTSPENAKLIVQKICDILSISDSAHADIYKRNTAAYIAQLSQLDSGFREIVKNAKRRTVVFADRFPARYFTEEYGLKYYAAFPGCSTDTEPSAATVAYIINKVKKEKIPAVFYIELSSQKMADTVCEAAGCKKLLFHSCHTLSKEDFAAGATYLSVMQKNLQTVSEALN